MSTAIWLQTHAVVACLWASAAAEAPRTPAVEAAEAAEVAAVVAATEARTNTAATAATLVAVSPPPLWCFLPGLSCWSRASAVRLTVWLRTGLLAAVW